MSLEEIPCKGIVNAVQAKISFVEIRLNVVTRITTAMPDNHINYSQSREYPVILTK